MKHRWTQSLTALLLLAALLPWAPPAGAATGRCFPDTGHCIDDRFQDYWDRRGALPIFGYPLAASSAELNADTKQEHLTQWFERNRMEHHPKNAAPYDVLLGRLGAELLLVRGIDPAALPTAPGPQAGCRWFDVTRHNVCDQAPGQGFKAYWESLGLELDGKPGHTYAESLALFGLPLSEPAMETNASGHTVLTQWFERARFEWHPANPAGHRVLLGLLGAELGVQHPLPISPAAISMPAGGAARFEVAGLPGRDPASTASVKWTAQGLPPGALAESDMGWGNPYDGPFEISSPPTLAPGSYPIQLTAAMPGRRWMGQVTLHIVPCAPTARGAQQLTKAAHEQYYNVGGPGTGLNAMGLLAPTLTICPGAAPARSSITVERVAYAEGATPGGIEIRLFRALTYPLSFSGGYEPAAQLIKQSSGPALEWDSEPGAYFIQFVDLSATGLYAKPNPITSLDYRLDVRP